MDKELIQMYFESAIYALAVGTPMEVIKYGELVFAEDDNFEGAEGFKQAAAVFKSGQGCRVSIPNDIDFGVSFNDDDYEEFE